MNEQKKQELALEIIERLRKEYPDADCTLDYDCLLYTSIWVVISMVIAVFIGVVGNAMSKAGVIPVLDDPETIILVVADLISRHGFLAAIVAGLILAGILAATMSTACLLYTSRCV